MSLVAAIENQKDPSSSSKSTSSTSTTTAAAVALGRIVSLNVRPEASTFDIHMITEDGEMRRQLLQFAESQSSGSYIHFFLSVSEYHRCVKQQPTDISSIERAAVALYHEFVCDNAEHALGCLSLSSRYALRVSLAHLLSDALSSSSSSTPAAAIVPSSPPVDSSSVAVVDASERMHARVASANDSRSLPLSQWIITIRVHLSDVYGGGHITIRCVASQSVHTIKTMALAQLRKKRMISSNNNHTANIDGGDDDADLVVAYSLTKGASMMDANESNKIPIEREHTSLCMSVSLDDAISALLENIPLEIGITPAHIPPPSASPPPQAAVAIVPSAVSSSSSSPPSSSSLPEKTNGNAKRDMIYELVQQPRVPLVNMYDEAEARVLNVIRVSIQPAFMEYMEAMITDDAGDDSDSIVDKDED